MKATRKGTLKWCSKYIKTLKMYLMALGCFDGTFSLHLKLDSKPYHMPPRCMTCMLQKPFQEELERLQKQDIIAALGVDETSEWCSSFVLVSKANGKVRLCLYPAWWKHALIRPTCRGPTLNEILPKLNNAKYLSCIDASSAYHNLKLDKKSSYFMMFAYQFGRYRYKQLPFGAAPADDMFQRKIDEIFKDMPDVFGIVDDILVAGYKADGRDHDETGQRVLQRCRQVNLKLNKDKCHFMCTSVPFFGEIIFQNKVQPDAQNTKALVEMPPPK